MHRIDSNGAVDGKWQPGNPAIGQKATQIPADWMNAIQEELCFLVTESGGVLDKVDTTQVYDAIVRIVSGVVGDGSGAVPTTRLVSTGGLAIGGGDLAGDRTITVPKASQAEASAGTDDTKALTPFAAAGLVGLTVSGSAWLIKIGPVLAQIFNAIVPANTNAIFTLPQAYTVENRAGFANGGNMSGEQKDNPPYVTGRGLSTVSVYSAIDSAVPVTIITFGV